MARLLGVSQSTTPLHRYRLPRTACVGSPPARPTTDVLWVRDGRCLVSHPSFGADGLPNYSSHQTDMYRYLLGDDECDWVIGNVERKTDRYERATRIEDCAVLFT